MKLVRQTTSSDCGAAAVAMCLAARGRDTSLAEVKLRTGIGSRRTSARGIIAALEEFSVAASAVHVPADDVHRLPEGSILATSQSHFVVLSGRRFGRRVVFDPARGRQRLSGYLAERLEVAIVVEGSDSTLSDSDQPVPRTTASSILRGELWRHRGSIASLALFTLGAYVAGAVPPLVLGPIVDRFVETETAPTLYVAAIIGGCGVFGMAALNALHRILTIRTHRSVREFAGRVVLARLANASVSVSRMLSGGDRLSRAGEARLWMTSGVRVVTSLISDIHILIVYLTLVFLLDSTLAAVLVALVGARVALFAFVQPALDRKHSATLIADGDLARLEEEIVSDHADIAARRLVSKSLVDWDERLVTSENAKQVHGDLSAGYLGVQELLANATPYVVMFLGLERVLAGDSTLGRTIATNGLAFGVLAPASALIMSAQTLRQMTVSSARIDEVLEWDGIGYGTGLSKWERSDCHPSSTLRCIAVKDLRFQYSCDAKWALHITSLELRQGITVLRGPSGVGKSTIARVLCGLEPRACGLIEARSDDGRSLALGALDIRLVGSSPRLFGTDISSVLGLAEGEVGTERVASAIRTFDLGEIAARWSSRDGGAGVSVHTEASLGQRQRIALLSCALSQPDILIMDEATSGIERALESRILKFLRTQVPIILCITHRESIRSDHELTVRSVVSGERAVTSAEVIER